MKKVFSLSIILAVLAAAFTFTSCNDDKGDSPRFELQVVGNMLSGKIYTDNDLAKATLEKGGTTVTPGWPIDNFKSGSIIGQDGEYMVVITGLTDGNYELIVTDKEDLKATFPFTIGTTNPINYNLDSFVAAEGDSYLYQYDGAPAGGFTIAEVAADGAGFKVVFSDGITATISYTGKSFLTVSGTTKSGGEAAADLGADLLLYLDGTTKTIKAGQLATFSGTPSAAKTTKFAKQ